MLLIRFRRLTGVVEGAHVHTTRCLPGQVTRAHTHDFHEVFIVLTGSGQHCINGRTVPLQPGLAVVIRPRDAHHFVSAVNAPLSFVNVAVPSAWWRAFGVVMNLPPGWERLGLEPGHALVPAHRRDDLESLLRRLEATRTDRRTLLMQLWQRVAETMIQSTSAPERREPPRWLEDWRRELLTAEPKHLVENITWWHRRSGRTAEHLARSCRLHYGITPSAMLGMARIEWAKRRLRTSEDKVITIALECGFSNLSYFHQQFLSRVGLSPGAWRKSDSLAVPH